MPNLPDIDFSMPIITMLARCPSAKVARVATTTAARSYHGSPVRGVSLELPLAKAVNGLGRPSGMRPPSYDFHATIFHLLGIDHEKLSFRHSGIDRRLTDVYGHVIKSIVP